MRLFAAFIQLFPLVTFIMTYRKKRELLSPINLITGLYIIRIMIPTILYCFPENYQNLSNLYLLRAVSSDGCYLLYSILQLIGYYLICLGTRVVFYVGKYPLKKQKSLLQEDRINKIELTGAESAQNLNYRIWGIVFWVIGAFAFLMIMKKTGGIIYFYAHLQYRISMTRNLDLLSWLLSLAHYGLLLIAYSYRGTKKKIGWIFFFCFVTGLMIGLGGRKPILMLLIETIVIIHYVVSPIKLKSIFTFRNILLCTAAFVMFVLMVSFRTEGAFERFLANPISFFLEHNQGITKLFMQESYVTFFMAIIYYFRTHDLWLGASFKGLLTAIIPSSLYPAKPPVDDGMYLYSICQGRTDIYPVMPVSELNGSSYPLETFGSMYANFGPIGVLIGMFLVGWVIGFFYRKIQLSDYRLFYMILYTQVLTGFEISTLRIFQIFSTMVLLNIVEFTGRHVRFVKTQKRLTYQEHK